MNTPQVIAGIDSSPLNESVTDYAAWIASTVSAPLTLLHNIEHPMTPVTSDLTGSIGLGSREHLLEDLVALEAQHSKLLVEQGKTLLIDAQERVTHFGISDSHKLQRHGPLSETLIELEDDIRVLVLGVRGENHSTDDSALGNQIEAIIRSLHKPVLVVNRTFEQPKELMLAYDGSEASLKALNWITSSPLYKDMTCHLVHACNDTSTGSNLIESATKQLEAASVKATTTVLTGDSLDVLLNYINEHSIDLLVMGSFGHSRLREMFLGSFTAKMLTRAKIPLLLLR